MKACIPQYSHLLSDLEFATAGKDTRETIIWSDTLNASFERAQKALSDTKFITIPRPSDTPIITNDGAVMTGGLGAVLYVLRKCSMMLGGYFSVKLKPHQLKWLLCEVEALAISASVNHGSKYIIESRNTVQILTDSRPCVQAYKRLCRGLFYSSARVGTFLSTLSRYKVSLQHIPGAANLPADYHSRNLMECVNKECQICTFFKDSANATVFRMTVDDVLERKVPMPFITKPAWKATQQDWLSLRRTYAHLSQGTRTNHKANNIRDVKRYLRVCTLGRDGLLVVRKKVPFSPALDLIVVPQHIVSGLITALNLRMQHPTKSQLSKIFHLYFYAFDADSEIRDEQCSHCTSLASFPQVIEEFFTSPPLPTPGAEFACDIMRRARQHIFLLRDCFSSFT